MSQTSPRRWRIFIVPGSHFDYGWCSGPGEALAYGDSIIRAGLELLEAHPDYRFTVEYAVFMQHYLASFPAETERVRGLLRAGRLEVGATWSGMMTNVFDAEPLVRNIVQAKRWARDVLGHDPLTAQLTDTPGHAAQLPQILADCGVKYLAYSRYSAPVPFHRWRAPDGSEVLAANHSLGLYGGIGAGWPDSGYGWGYEFRAGFENARERVPEQLAQAAEKWPTEAILMGEESDLRMPDATTLEALPAWNEAFPHAPARMATITEFFEQADTGNLPVFGGELPYEFYSIPAFEVETYHEARRAEHTLTAAETFAAWQDAFGLGGPEPKRLDEAWAALPLPHDHNVGGRHGEINDEVRIHCARHARILAEEALRGSILSIITHIRYEREAMPLVVFNPLSWERSDVVETYVEFVQTGVQGLRIEDAAGREYPAQVLRREEQGGLTRVTFVFVAEGVPPVGYKAFYLTALPEPAEASSPLEITPDHLASRFYTLELEDGFLRRLTSSLVPRPSSLVPSDSHHHFNEVVVLEDTEVDVAEGLTGREWRAAEQERTVEVVESGPVRAVLRVRGQVLNSPLVQEIALYDALPRIDLTTSVEWEGRHDCQVRLALPLAVPDGRLTYETPFAPMAFPDGEMPGTYRGTGGRFTHRWIDFSNDGYGLTLASRHGCHSLSADGKLYAVLLRTTFSCGTPFLWYEQRGRHTFHHSLLAHAGDWRAAHAFRHGWEFNSPLWAGRMCTARPIEPIRGKTTLPETASLCTIDAPNVALVTLKPADDGEGWILRLLETNGEATAATLTLARPLVAAWAANLLEEPGRAWPVSGSTVSLRLGAYRLQTVRLR